VTGLFELTGSYTLHPGAQLSITGHRPVMGQGLLTRLLQGQNAAQVVQTLGHLFALCSHAQRHTARLAMQAAQYPDQTCSSPAASQQLALHTALDHLRSMRMDWTLPGGEPTHGASAAMSWPSPLPPSLAQQDLTPTQVSAALTQLRRWLQDQVLHQSVDQWLALHNSPEAFLDWCRTHNTTLAPLRFLATCHAQASAIEPTAQPLNLLDPDLATQSKQLQEVAQAIRHQAGFAQRPKWQGQCAETGAWTRLRHREAPSSFTKACKISAWSRMASRWVEVLELSRADLLPESAAPLLSSGALALGGGQALAWTEMARGLLLHWVQLDAQARVQAYQVVAPTEWNFHPQGTLARALTHLAPQDCAGATLLGQAFDACVACQVRPANIVELCDA
jgi:hypothetical protein